MDRMLVVIFNNELKGYEAADTLESLKEEGEIGLTGEWVLTRQEDGTVAIVKTDDTLPEGTMAGTIVGGLIGLFGGPVGLTIGAASGAAVGATADMARARLDQDFVAEISRSLAPGKTALVAEINEDEPEAVDTRMMALGGQVFRRDLSDVADTDQERHATDQERHANEIKSHIAHTGRDIADDYRGRKRSLTSRVKALFHGPGKDDKQR
jgi:uncharacterized membrane protein